MVCVLLNISKSLGGRERDKDRERERKKEKEKEEEEKRGRDQRKAHYNIVIFSG